MTYKSPINYRPTPAHIPSEAFTVSGGFALLAEAPPDPVQYPIIVTVAGNPRTRVDVTPTAGQYRILTQTLPGPAVEWLSVLQFHASDEGLSGIADYYGAGTILSSQFFDMLVAFLTPLVVASQVSLPPPTMAQSERGRRGDVAFLEDGSGFFSDGAAWVPFVGGGVAGSFGSLTLGMVFGLALDAGYVGPDLAGSTDLSASFGMTFDATYDAPGAWSGSLTLAQVLGVTMDASYQAGGGSSLLTDLISYWKLDESANANATDALGVNTLTRTGTVGTGSGKVGTARTFTETVNGELSKNACVNMPTTGSLSLYFWVKTPTGIVQAGNQPITVFANPVTGSGLLFNYTPQYNDGQDDQPDGLFLGRYGTANSTISATPNLSLSTFAAFYIQFDSPTGKVAYSINNGSLTVASSVCTSPTNLNNGTISLSSSAPVSLDEVGFWNRILTSDERTSLYNSGNGLTHPFS